MNKYILNYASSTTFVETSMLVREIKFKITVCSNQIYTNKSKMPEKITLSPHCQPLLFRKEIRMKIGKSHLTEVTYIIPRYVMVFFNNMC